MKRLRRVAYLRRLMHSVERWLSSQGLVKVQASSCSLYEQGAGYCWLGVDFPGRIEDVNGELSARGDQPLQVRGARGWVFVVLVFDRHFPF